MIILNESIAFTKSDFVLHSSNERKDSQRNKGSLSQYSRWHQWYEYILPSELCTDYLGSSIETFRID